MGRLAFKKKTHQTGEVVDASPVSERMMEVEGRQSKKTGAGGGGGHTSYLDVMIMASKVGVGGAHLRTRCE